MKHFIKYSLAVIFIIIIIVAAVHIIRNAYKTYTNEEIETEMLQVRAKAQLEFEKYHVDNENGLKGEKIENSEYGIEEEGNFFKWTKETLTELGLEQNLLKDGEYYIVNYDTEEVIYSTGIKDEDGKEYHKLSEIEELLEKKDDIENNETKIENIDTETNNTENENLEGEDTNDGEGDAEAE